MIVDSPRPAQPYLPPRGYHWVAQPDPEWRPSAAGKLCRKAGGRRKACGDPAVAEQRHDWVNARGTPCTAWWAHCPAHLGGVWLEHATVYGWKLVRNTGER